MEEWKPIPNHEDYLVSDHGRIVSLRTGLMKQNTNSRGYVIVSIDGKSQRLHRLIADVFIKNPDGKEFVNHIDGNKENNAVTNLEWCTNSENQKHSYDVLHHTTKHKTVVKKDGSGKVISLYKSMAECERSEGFACDSLRDIIRKHRVINGCRYEIVETV